MARLQVGINPDNHGICPFLNWAKTPSNLDAGPRLMIGGVDYGYVASDISARFNANHELTDTSTCTRFSYYPFLHPVSITGNWPNFHGKAMVAKWSTGAAVTGVTGFGANLSAITSKRVTFNMTNGAQDNMTVSWTLNGTNGGPTAIKICEASKEALLDAGGVMDPDWLAFYSQYHSARFMDAMGTNDSQAVDFADMASVSDAYWGGSSRADKYKVGWPPEAIIEYLNYNSQNIAWINIPHQFTDAAITSWFTAIKNGVTDWSHVRLKLEYSNEPWNGQFAQYTYCQTQGGLLGWTTGNATEKAWQYAGYRAAQGMEIARTVFVTDSGTKWQGVFCPQTANTSSTDFMKVGIDRHISSDAGAASVITKLFSRMGVAGYIGISPTDSTSGDGLLLKQWATAGTFTANIYNSMKVGATAPGTGPYPTGNWFSNDATRAAELAQKAKADSYGLVVDQYEAGNHIVCFLPMRDDGTGDTTNQAMADFAATDLCAQLFADRCEQFISDTGGVPSRYVIVGPHSKYGQWGGYETYEGYAIGTGNACEAVNLGIPYQPGKRNVQTY